MIFEINLVALLFVRTRTGESRGFAFVRYKYADEAQKAVDRLDGMILLLCLVIFTWPVVSSLHQFLVLQGSCLLVTAFSSFSF